MEAVNETRALSCFEFVSNFGIRISDFSSLLQYTHLMPTYAAFLGHQPAISLAELMVMLPDLKPKKQWDPRIVTFEAAQEITTDWLRQLGGTVLIARESPSGDDGANRPSRTALPARPAGGRAAGKPRLEEIVPKLLHKELKEVKRKATFSFRCMGVPRSEIRSLYRVCKKHLKEKNLASRYIGNERHPAKPGTLLLRGIPGPESAEIVILQDAERKNTWVGKTCAVQDIEAYTNRDMGKPFRDTETGLMPPKLAQVLLNLSLIMLPEKRALIKDPKKGAALWEGITVWDPFCGSGVIALEALMRRAHMIASDRTEKAVAGCTENIRWLRLKEKTPKAITHYVFKQNALKPAELPKRPTVIVTETSLGPALKKPPTKKEVATLVRDAEELEAAFFENMAMLFPEVPIVCTFPVYISRDGERNFLQKILRKTEKLGYRRTMIGTSFLKTTDRQSLLYLRPDQMVGREIFCFLPARRSAEREGGPPMKK